MRNIHLLLFVPLFALLFACGLPPIEEENALDNPSTRTATNKTPSQNTQETGKTLSQKTQAQIIDSNPNQQSPKKCRVRYGKKCTSVQVCVVGVCFRLPYCVTIRKCDPV